jgi:hypothetical protein
MLHLNSFLVVLIALAVFVVLMTLLSIFVWRCSLHQETHYHRLGATDASKVAPLGYWSAHYGRRIAVLPEHMEKHG